MSVIKKVAFYTLGCKLNFSETSTISRSFQRENYKIVNATQKAEGEDGSSASTGTSLVCSRERSSNP